MGLAAPEQAEQAISTPAIEQGAPRRRNRATTAWNEECVGLLKKFHAEGHSFSRIANEIHAATGIVFTRNACIGKAGREGLPDREIKKTGRKRLNAHGDRGLTKKIRIKQSLPADFTILNRIDALALPEHRGLSLVNPNHRIDDTTCKFPKGDGAAITFCGHPTQEDSPYCNGHHQICYRKVA